MATDTDDLSVGDLVRYTGSETEYHGVWRVQLPRIPSGDYEGRTLLVDPDDERRTLIPSAGNRSLQLDT